MGGVEPVHQGRDILKEKSEARFGGDFRTPETTKPALGGFCRCFEVVGRGDLNPRLMPVLCRLQRGGCHFAVIVRLHCSAGSLHSAGSVPPLKIMYVAPAIRKLLIPLETGQR